MNKRIEKDGKFYRMRRGVLVEIPQEWVGKGGQTDTKARQSKRPRKERRMDDSARTSSRYRHTGRQDKETQAGHADVPPVSRKMKPDVGSRTHNKRAAIIEDGEGEE